jgi:hypothetical protein
MPTPRQRLRSVGALKGHRRNKTSLLHDLTRTGGQARSHGRDRYGPGPLAGPRRVPVKSPLHDVGQLAEAPDGATAKLLLFLRTASWWSQTGSNRRPHACKARALPAELWPLQDTSAASRRAPGDARASPDALRQFRRNCRGMVGLGRLELPTSRLSSARSNQLSYKPEARHPERPERRSQKSARKEKRRRQSSARRGLRSPYCSNEEPRGPKS